MNKRLVFTSALLVAGCSMAPRHERPALPVPTAWPQSGVEGRTTVSKEWRRFFLDPRLQAMIAAALEHNRDMRIAVSRVEEARAQYGVARADRLPNVNLVASRNATRTPADLTPTGTAAVTSRRADVNLGLLAFELDFWGRVANLSDAARASFLATEEARRAFQLSLVADVADGYLLLKEAEERSELAAATVAARAETLRLIAKRREVGLAGDLDVLQADGAYESARAELSGLERQRQQAENLLRALVGIEKPDWPKGRSLKDQGIVPDLDAGLPAEVLTRRPDILAAEQRLLASNANIGAARAAFFPRISLTGSYGTASPQLSGLFDSGTSAWMFMPSISLPIFSGGRNEANLDLAQARKVIAVAEYERAIQQAFREVADGLAARQRLGEQVVALEAYEKTQKQRLILAEARYQQGISSFLEVLDAQRDQFSAQQAVIQARRALLSASSRLYKALGGGEG